MKNAGKTSASARPSRWVSVDVFRGVTILGMILVNNPGDWSTVYGPLLHAEWHGWTPTDLIFPFFLFIVGVAIVLALGRKVEQGAERGALVRKILRRSAILFALGLFLSGFPFGLFGPRSFERLLETWRIPGVLQRIAVCYLGASLMFLFLRQRALKISAVLLLFGYWALLTQVPVPPVGGISEGGSDGEVVAAEQIPADLASPDQASSDLASPSSPSSDLASPGLPSAESTSPELVSAELVSADLASPDLVTPGRVSADLVAPDLASKGQHLAGWLDRVVFGDHLWVLGKVYDPEGILSTLPALATTLFGIFAGLLLVSKLPAMERAARLLVVGTLLAAAGYVWSWFLPINKALWTSSYAVFTAGLAFCGLGLCYWFFDLRRHPRLARPFTLYGVNAITVFVGSGLLARTLAYVKVGPQGTESLQSLLYQTLFASWLPPYTASLAYAITWVLGWFLLLAFMERRGWVWKV